MGVGYSVLQCRTVMRARRAGGLQGVERGLDLAERGHAGGEDHGPAEGVAAQILSPPGSQIVSRRGGGDLPR